MIYELYHETIFKYDALVSFSHNIARLKPKTNNIQTLLDYELVITPTPYETSEFMDYFGNLNSFMLIREAHTELSVTAKSKVLLNVEEIKRVNEEVKNSKITLKETLERLSSFNKDDVMAKQFLFATESIPNVSDEIKAYILESFDENRPLYEACYELMNRIFTDFKFVSGFSDVTTPIEIIFKEKKGVCQDFAQFAIAGLRTIGIPARYQSGYIQTLPLEGEVKLFGADASHAWFSVYIPDFGWMDFDPTNNKVPNEEYILLGYGRDYLDIAPLKGVVQSSGNSILSVKVNVERVQETPDIKELSQSQSQTQSQSQM